MTNNRIYVEPVGGLCNRMRVIASLYEIVHALGWELVVIWRIDNGLNCSYRKLFSLPEDITVIEQVANTKFKKIIWKAKEVITNFRYKVIEDDEVQQLNSSLESAKEFIETLIPEKKKLYFRTCESMNRYYYYNDYSIFNPIEKISRIIDGVLKCGGGQTLIGLHIRRTDHKLSIAKSKTDYFLNAMVQEHSNCAGKLVFYVASDDDKEKQAVIEKAKHMERCEIKFYDGELSRNSAGGVEAAYVDLLCLSKCRKIYGSAGSSFSKVAASIGKCEYEDTAGEIKEKWSL